MYVFDMNSTPPIGPATWQALSNQVRLAATVSDSTGVDRVLREQTSSVLPYYFIPPGIFYNCFPCYSPS